MQPAKRHDTLKRMPSKGTNRKSFRIEGELWDEFGAATLHHKDGRSGVLRDFIRWFMEKPGASLPARRSTDGQDPASPSVDATDGKQ